MKRNNIIPITRKKKSQEPLHGIHYIVFSTKKNEKTLMCFLFFQVYWFSKTNGKADGLPY